MYHPLKNAWGGLGVCCITNAHMTLGEDIKEEMEAGGGGEPAHGLCAQDKVQK